MTNILIIEENRKWQKFLVEALSDKHKITYWPNGQDISYKLREHNYDVILLSLQLQRKDGFRLMKSILSKSPHVPIITTSEEEKAEIIVKAVKEGAFDFLSKPFTLGKIELAINRALENRSLKNEIDYLRRTQDVIYDFEQIVAYSPVMQKVMANIKKFAATDSTILMTGETGTGKSFLAGSVNFNSTRRNKPFININCANIPETLLESELLGHDKGAFTGADKVRIGRLEQANGGTIFLDEIAEMSPALQAKFLRVLETRSFERLGGNQTLSSDVRIIAATNRVLEEEVKAGNFREDLYYRINVLRVHLPPLRERRQCIEPLATRLLAKSCVALKKKMIGFSPAVIAMFKSYFWPGNIRQLANTVERAVILEETSLISEENIFLPEFMTHQPDGTTASNQGASEDQSLRANEKEMILKALNDSLWIQKDAAKRLGLSPRVLNYKIKKLGIKHPRWLKNK